MRPKGGEKSNAAAFYGSPCRALSLQAHLRRLACGGGSEKGMSYASNMTTRESEELRMIWKGVLEGEHVNDLRGSDDDDDDEEEEGEAWFDARWGRKLEEKEGLREMEAGEKDLMSENEEKEDRKSEKERKSCSPVVMWQQSSDRVELAEFVPTELLERHHVQYKTERKKSWDENDKRYLSWVDDTIKNSKNREEILIRCEEKWEGGKFASQHKSK